MRRMQTHSSRPNGPLPLVGQPSNSRLRWFRFLERQAESALAAANNPTANKNTLQPGAPSRHFKDGTPNAVVLPPVVPQAAPTESTVESGVPSEAPDGTWDDTFAVFSGGRAVAENLQFDRRLRVASQDGPKVDLASIPGITIQPMDWAPLVKQIPPQTDPLAAAIPADQHAILCPNLDSMLRLMDESDEVGTPGCVWQRDARKMSARASGTSGNCAWPSTRSRELSATRPSAISR